jgi:hypothetical protein
MEEEIVLRLSGKWSHGVKKRSFTAKEIKEIEQSMIDGYLLSEILEKHKIDRNTLHRIFKEYVHARPAEKPMELPSRSTFILGKKTLWDFKTEKEMLEEEPYTWESLSNAEKKFYYKYKFENLL